MLIVVLLLGLRGRMEAGWSRMNDLIVIQASQVGSREFLGARSDNQAPIIRASVLTFLSTSTMQRVAALLSVMTIGTAQKGGPG